MSSSRPTTETNPLIDEDELHFHIDDMDPGVERESQMEDCASVDQSFDVMRPSPLSNGPVEQWEADEREERRQVGGAAVAGGIAGLVLIGPVVGLMLAGGAAAVATTKGKAGQVTRATGEVMAKAGDRLKEMNRKHHITEKASQGLAKSADWVSNKLKPKRERERDAMYGLTA